MSEKKFDDYFHKIKEIGKGGSSYVIEASTKNEVYNIPPFVNVAIKIMKQGQESFDIQKEVDILKKVSFRFKECNPNIVCYFASGKFIKDGEKVFVIITEYIDGYSIGALVRKIRSQIIGEYNILAKFDFEKIINLLKGLASNLDLLHDDDIVHRDIKAENIMFSKTDKTFKFIDFGLSCFTNISSQYSCGIMLKGTIRYISPELWGIYYKKDKEIDFDTLTEIYKKSDVWALGLVFHFLLFGNFPIELQGSKPVKEIINIVQKQKELTIKSSTINLKLIKILKDMLKKDYKLRSSAKEVVNELGDLL